MAYAGNGALFVKAGFIKAADPDAVSGGVPRVLMRRLLARATDATPVDTLQVEVAISGRRLARGG